ncbi:MAG: hypothetical protein JOS17DRAFT_304430 [Linnemannia elongata]|nr:MAG: hypothetical protein JOS17DRAFT_304430 [Linnemannia elongata]
MPYPSLALQTLVERRSLLQYCTAYPIFPHLFTRSKKRGERKKDKKKSFVFVRDGLALSSGVTILHSCIVFLLPFRFCLLTIHASLHLKKMESLRLHGTSTHSLMNLGGGDNCLLDPFLFWGRIAPSPFLNCLIIIILIIPSKCGVGDGGRLTRKK